MVHPTGPPWSAQWFGPGEELAGAATACLRGVHAVGRRGDRPASPGHACERPRAKLRRLAATLVLLAPRTVLGAEQRE
jgi:hypothetical protein